MVPKCKDCIKQYASDGAVWPPGLLPRPAPYPGPRCATHNREVKKKRKEAAHASMVQRVYHLKPGEYERLYVGQNGRCAICERATGASRKLSVDHDHDTGEVRGLLCRTCNNMLGHARDDYRMFAEAARYLVCPPARAILRKP